MATSFVREKHVTFPVLPEKQLFNTLKRYPELGEITLNDLRAVDARWWQEVLYLLLKNCKWIYFDEGDFHARVQACPEKRFLIFLKLLQAYWAEIAQLAFIKPAIELCDLTRPTKERIAQILSGFINLDIFISKIPSNPDIESFSAELNDIKTTEEQDEHQLKRLAELEEQVERKREEVARNMEVILQLRCEADRLANEKAMENELLESLKGSTEEKLDSLHLINTKDEELQRKIGVIQSEIDRLREYHVPDIDSFIQQPVILKGKLEDLRKQSESTAKNHAKLVEVIHAYQLLEEEIKVCASLCDRSLKIGKELEKVRGELNSVEQEIEAIDADNKNKHEEKEQLNATVTAQVQRQRRHAAASPGPMLGSQSSQVEKRKDDNAQDDDVVGRIQEGDALMKLLQERERLRQSFYTQSHDLDFRYHKKRDCLADNHDQFIDYIRGMMAALIKEGLFPAPVNEDDEDSWPKENAVPASLSQL